MTAIGLMTRFKKKKKTNASSLYINNKVPSIALGSFLFLFSKLRFNMHKKNIGELIKIPWSQTLAAAILIYLFCNRSEDYTIVDEEVIFC